MPQFGSEAFRRAGLTGEKRRQIQYGDFFLDRFRLRHIAEAHVRFPVYYS